MEGKEKYEDSNDSQFEANDASHLKDPNTRLKFDDEKRAKLLENNMNADTLLNDVEEETKEFRDELDAKIEEITALKATSTETVQEMKVDDEIYSGPVQDGLPHGEGEWISNWGEVFKGTWL